MQFDLRWFLLTNITDTNNLQSIYKFSVIILFLLFMLFAFSPFFADKFRGNKFKSFLLSEAIFVISIIVFVLAARWPCFLPPELNPDESQMIAGSLKLLKDPVFWRSVDGTTSGPLNYYPLVLFSLSGIKLEYAAARIVGLMLILISLICCYYALKQIYNNVTTRLTLILLVVSVAFMTHFDYVHYTSEHVSITILSISLLIFCKLYSRGLNNNKKLIFLLGFTLGLVPYAKLQGVPIAFAISLAFLHLIYSSSRTKLINNFFLFMSGALLFSAFAVIYIIIFSLQDVFWISYIKQNIFYATFHTGYFKKFLGLFSILKNSKNLLTFFILTAISLIGFAVFLFHVRFLPSANKSKPNLSPMFFYSLLLLAAATFSIIQTGNAFRHYLLFLLIPCGFLIGVVAGEFYKYFNTPQTTTKTINRLAAAFIILIIVLSGSQLTHCLLKKYSKYISSRKSYIENYLSPTSSTILKYASPGQPIAIWGWEPKLYVETGTIAATRDFTCEWQMFLQNKYTLYYVNRFVNDFRKSGAILFIDASGPGTFVHSFFSNFHTMTVPSFNDYSELATIVKNNYYPISEVENVKIYLKRKHTNKSLME